MGTRFAHRAIAGFTLNDRGHGAIVTIASHLRRKSRRAETPQVGLVALSAAEEGRSQMRYPAIVQRRPQPKCMGLSSGAGMNR